jgi:hypothetical protein
MTRAPAPALLLRPRLSIPGVRPRHGRTRAVTEHFLSDRGWRAASRRCRERGGTAAASEPPDDALGAARRDVAIRRPAQVADNPPARPPEAAHPAGGRRAPERLAVRPACDSAGSTTRHPSRADPAEVHALIAGAHVRVHHGTAGPRRRTLGGRRARTRQGAQGTRHNQRSPASDRPHVEASWIAAESIRLEPGNCEGPGRSTRWTRATSPPAERLV